MNPKRRGKAKSSAIPEIKIIVIGAPGVGKTALTVRFLTKRYIGEYDHRLDFKYRHEMFLDGDPLLVEIMDTCPKCQLSREVLLGTRSVRVDFTIDRPEAQDQVPPASVVERADAICMVYSVTDRDSFNFVRRFRDELSADVPLTLVGNKADVEQLRQVSYEEGEILAKDYECSFAEVAAAEQVDQVAEVFHQLCRDVLATRRRIKHGLLGRVLGSRNTRAYSRGKSDSALPRE